VTDVIVVGAGLPGLVTAWRLAQQGLSVTVFDRITIGGGSSSLAAGHVPSTADESGELTVKLRTRALVREIEAQTGSVIFFREVGGLEIARDQATADYLAARAVRKQALGCDASVLSAAEIGERWPTCRSDDLIMGVWTPGDWLVRSIYLTVGLAGLARLAGATIIEGCPVDALALDGDRVTGVKVGDDTVSALAVVLAAGAGTRRIAGNSHIKLPLRLAALDLVGLLGARSPLPFISEFSPGAERDGFYLINPVPGWIFAGGPVRDGEGVGAWGGPVAADPASTAYLHRMIARRIQDAGRPVPGSGWSGLLETTPDGRPLIGEWPQVRGLYLASGFGGGGVQRMSAAEMVAAQIAGTREDVHPAGDQASRFAAYAGEEFPLWDGPYRKAKEAAVD
jgi:sarcosine oxidase subunit beta